MRSGVYFSGRWCRASPYFHGLPYPPISVLKTDQAGEWDKDNVAFQQMVKRRGVIVKYAPKDRHERSAAHAERACGIVEVTMKSLLMQSNCPSSMWQDALSQTEFLLNRLPPVSPEWCEVGPAAGSDIANTGAATT